MLIIKKRNHVKFYEDFVEAFQIFSYFDFWHSRLQSFDKLKTYYIVVGF